MKCQKAQNILLFITIHQRVKLIFFGIDDISYEQVATGADDDITEYIIYRDGKKIASVKGSQHTLYQ